MCPPPERQQETQRARLPRLDKASADIRNAVKALLTTVTSEPTAGTELPTGPADALKQPARFIIGVSGGADSMALAAACAHLAKKYPWEFCAAIVDHGLQAQSAEVAAATRTQLTDLGLTAAILPVTVDPGDPAGLEAAARTARYAALETHRQEKGAAGILLGHTLNDQAETVLLGLARGSGTRSLAGMRPQAGKLLRPLLKISREETRASAAAQGLTIWDDPMNSDPAYARVRVRTQVLPAMEASLGAGIVKNLARTAALLAADADELDAQARERGNAYVSGENLSRSAAQLPAALRRRVVRDWLQKLCPPNELTAGHIEQVSALVTGDRTGAVSVPGAAEVRAQHNAVRWHRLQAISAEQETRKVR